MSVRFQESVQQTVSGGNGSGGMPGAGAAFNAARGQFRSQDFGMGKAGRSELFHEIGEAVTKGEGAGGYLQAYLKYLDKSPLRVKMLTSGTLSGAQEFLASWIAQDRNRNGNYFTSRVPKMAIYGAFVSAPMGHFLIKLVHFLFSNRTSLKAKIFEILFSNLILAPMQNSIYLVTLAIVHGARTFHQIRATVRAGFWPIMTVSWIASPLCLAFAQQFLPQQYWVPFFNFVAFCIGTYGNSQTKKKRLVALRRRRDQESREYGSTGATTQYRDVRTDVRSDVRTEGGDSASYGRRAPGSY